ncbi:MAG: cupin domain-containing protein [Plectolyngbya sp. WJT66-NPBG17]|nr:cupin domain-containing protein [Plectolyngbya sp. WJT66-NPBG17]
MRRDREVSSPNCPRFGLIFGEWYDQPRDEGVLLLQGKAQLMYEDGNTIGLKAGDYLLISAHQRHRVSYISSNPTCIWLAIPTALRKVII